MATKTKKYAVRIVLAEKDCNSEVDTLLECLRYAGVVSPSRYAGQNIDRANCHFDLHAPRNIASAQTQVWARMNAERMRSFGLNAEAIVSPF